MQSILTPLQAKSARKFLEISQSYASQAIGINRAYLSQFENGKINLDATDLDSIKEFYTLEGYEFDNELELKESNNDFYSDELLQEIEANEQQIKKLSEYNIRKNHTQEPLFSEPYLKPEDINKYVIETVMLLARNYILTQQLNKTKQVDGFIDFSKAETTGDFVLVLFWNKSSSLFESKEDDWF